MVFSVTSVPCAVLSFALPVLSFRPRGRCGQTTIARVFGRGQSSAPNSRRRLEGKPKIRGKCRFGPVKQAGTGDSINAGVLGIGAKLVRDRPDCGHSTTVPVAKSWQRGVN